MAEKDKSKKSERKAGSDGYVEHIEHVQATRPEPWPGIRGRSRDEESELPTGTPREEQASVTKAQRRLEQEVEGSKEPARE